MTDNEARITRRALAWLKGLDLQGHPKLCPFVPELWVALLADHLRYPPTPAHGLRELLLRLAEDDEFTRGMVVSFRLGGQEGLDAMLGQLLNDGIVAQIRQRLEAGRLSMDLEAVMEMNKRYP